MGRRKADKSLAGDVALRVAAPAGFGFDSVFVGVLARLAAVLFHLDFSRKHAIAQIVRAFDGLVHELLLPPYHGALTT